MGQYYIKPFSRAIEVASEECILAWSNEKMHNMKAYSTKADIAYDYSDDIEGADNYRSNLWGD